MVDIENKTMRRPIGSVVKANEDGSIRFKLITNDVDRYSEVVLPFGAQLDNWKSNPIWLWGHNLEKYGGMLRPPIGKININTIEQNDDALEVDVFFDEIGQDAFAAMIADKHRTGFLNACSVGFIPITISKDTVKTGQKGVTHVKYDVLEGSSVPIPANPNALQQKEWGEFYEACIKNGSTIESMSTYMKVMGWEDDIINDAFTRKDAEKLSKPFDQNKAIAEIRQRAVFAYEQLKNDNDLISQENDALIQETLDILKLIRELDPYNTKQSKSDEILDAFNELKNMYTEQYKNIRYVEVINELTKIKELIRIN